MEFDVSAAGARPLTGRRVRLVRAGPGHADFFRHCYADDGFMDHYRLAQSRDESLGQIAARLADSHATIPQQRRAIEWVIERKGEGALTPVGIASIADIQLQHRRGELLIGVPDKADRSGGVPLESTLLLFDFFFNQIRMAKLVSFVYSFNSLSQHNTLELGFVQEGFLEEHILHARLGAVSLYQNGMLERRFRENSRLARLSKRLIGRDITSPPEMASRVDGGADRFLKAFLKSG
jgi:RimJ/RimL family protein N-acetyltransferase